MASSKGTPPPPQVGTDLWFDPRKLAQVPVQPWEEYKLGTDFEICKHLGEGTFGYVCLARTVRTNFYVALKVVHAKQVKAVGLQKDVQREMDKFLHLEHPNVVQIFGCFLDQDNIVSVLEFVPGGTLMDEMKNQPLERFSDVRAATYILQVIKALEYLHSQGVIRRDIKPESLLIGFRGEIKMTDFGCSVKTGYCSFLSRRKTLCGTLDYMPPEMGNGEACDKRMDLWSLGVLTYELLVGNPSEAKDQSDTLSLISCGQRRFRRFVGAQAKKFISGLLKQDPNQRLELQEARNLAWIVKYAETKKEGCLPMFQKYSYLEPTFKKRYEEAAKLSKK